MDEITQDDYVSLLSKANRWKLQALVAEIYAQEFQRKYSDGKPFAHPDDLHREIVTMTNHFMKQKMEGIDILRDPFFDILDKIG